MTEKRFDKQRRRLKKGESQRTNGTYDYRWTDKYGKRHAIYAQTLDELRSKEELILLDKLDGIKCDGKNATLNATYKDWLATERGLRGSTLRNYVNSYERYIYNSIIGRMKISEIKKSDIKRFYYQLIEKEKCSIPTVKAINYVLAKVFDFAVDDCRVRNNVTHRVINEITNETEWAVNIREALSVEHEQIFIEQAQSSKYKHLMLVLLGTGMRIGEALALQWDDVDFEKNIIKIKYSISSYRGFEKGDSFEEHVATPKTKTSIRTIPMFDSVRNVLLDLKMRHDEIVRAGISLPQLDGYSNFVFYSKWGKILKYNTALTHLRKINERCKIVAEKENLPEFPNVTFHVLRHTFATRLYENEVKLKFIQDVLGHSSSNITLGVYVSATDKLKNEQVKIIHEKGLFENNSWGIYAN